MNTGIQLMIASRGLIKHLGFILLIGGTPKIIASSESGDN